MTIPRYSEAFYQMIFTNTAATIVSGAVAERLNLPCYFVYGFLLSGGWLLLTMSNYLF
jgi:Amt family ammonium transporter